MVEVKLFLNKDINTNSNFYFEKAKKLKAKLPGIERTIKKTQEEIDNFEKKKEEYLKKKELNTKLKLHKKEQWFDKFRHTRTSSGLLCVFGSDAGTNEVLIKKHMQENDLVLHTQEPGSPFGLIKNGKENASKDEIFQAAQFLCCFSAQWKKGFGTADAFWVHPNQVTKKANTGEYMSKGSFMIYGDKNILKNIPLIICVGVEKKQIETEEGDENIDYLEIFSGSEKAVKTFCKNGYLKIEPGKDTYKALTKTIKKRLKISRIDDLPKFVPNNSKVLKR